jgi:hypothetical protein
VVEARRHVGGPTAFATTHSTLPLEPLSEKPAAGLNSPGARPGTMYNFWSRLKCW